MWGNLCPCEEDNTPDVCDSTNMETPANGYWDCSWTRNFNALNRMNKCELFCYGDDLESEADNFRTKGKARCWREQGKNHRDRGITTEHTGVRDIGVWKVGRKSADRLTCE